MASHAASFQGMRAAHVASPDSAVVERCKQGDVEAFCELVSRYQDRVYSFVARSVRNRADAEDLAQDVFVQAYGAVREFRSDASFKTWLFRIAHNRVIDYSRRSRTRSEVNGASLDEPAEDDLSPAEKTPGPDMESPLNRLCREELAAKVHHAVSTLSDKLRVVIVLYDFEGCSYEEIAEVLGRPIGTVKSRLFNARAELKRKLAPYMDVQDERRSVS